MLRPDLQIYLDELESVTEVLDDLVIADRIEKILSTPKEKAPERDELAEHLAFRFVPKHSDRATGWGTYYGPALSFTNDSNQIVEFPSIERIDEDILSYWRKRAYSSKNPFLVTRYADLVVDFETIIKKTKVDYLFARKVIGSTIEMCTLNLEDALGCKTKLKRALELAIRFGDQDTLEEIKKTIIQTEDKFAQDEKAGLWGYAFQWLILENAKKVLMSLEDTNKLVRNIELRLTRLAATEDPNTWCIEHGALLLADHYSKTADESALELVLSKLENAYRKNKRANSDGILVVNYLEKLFNVYHKYSHFKSANLSKERILTELSNLGDRGKFSTQEISIEIPINKNDTERFIQSIFGTDPPSQLADVLVRLALNFIPKKDLVTTQLNDLCKRYIFQSLGNHVVISQDGFPIAKFGSVQNDYDKHLLQHYSQSLSFGSYFLNIAFREFRKRFTANDLFSFLSESLIFRPEDQTYVLRTLKCFWEQDYLACNSLLLPLIEDGVRSIFRINNVSYIKLNTDGGYDVLPLNNLLHQGLIKEVYGVHGENIQYYFQVLLTEGIGWNLRNNLAHGINKHLFISEDITYRLLHVLLCLSLNQRKNQGN